MKPQPLICVRDVEAGSSWYQRSLGLRDPDGYVIVVAGNYGDLGN